MQLIRNTGYIRSQQRRGRLFTMIGFVGLAIAFVLVWWQRENAPLIIASYALMIVGFLFFNMGLQTIGKFVSNERKKRSDEQIDRALARLNDRYTAIHYARIGKRTVDHLIVHTSGVLVLTIREVTGKVIVNGRSWRKGGNPLGRLMNYSAPQLGNPAGDNDADVETVRETLREAGLPEQVEGAIVFTSPLAEVTGESPIDVVGIDGLLELVREVANAPGATPLNSRERQAVVAALSQGAELEQSAPRLERRKRTAA
jgi:hypothetical protein